MTEHEFEFHRAEEPYPVDDRRGTVLMLPGRGYTCGMSLLAWTTRLSRPPGGPCTRQRGMSPAFPTSRAGSSRTSPGDWTRWSVRPGRVVAKSLGTLAAHWAAEREYPAVWLTPVLKTAGPMPGHSDALAERIRTYPTDSLVVGGTADELWPTGFRSTGRA